jgi:hypothetical protein
MKASKNMKNTRRTAKPRTVCHTLADCPRLVDRAENCSTSKVNTSNPSPDLPNGRSYRDKSLGTSKASNKDVMPQNFFLLTP